MLMLGSTSTATATFLRSPHFTCSICTLLYIPPQNPPHPIAIANEPTDQIMAGGSVRKKSNNKKSNNNKNNNQIKLQQQPSMPTSSFVSPFSSSRLSYRTLSLLLLPMLSVVVLVILSISSNVWGTIGSKANLDARLYTIQVVNEFPHDRNAFTQGLLYEGNDTLYESTGLYGQSSVRKVALQTGKVEDLRRMDKNYFGEGLTLLDGRLFQVSWLTNTGFIYDQNNLSQIGKFIHQMTDGWGLATDGKILFGSDGTSGLYKIDPETLQVINRQTVKYKGHEVHRINELEWVNGEVWANVWQTDCIARISHKDGVVLGWILLDNLRESLFKTGETHIDVLNGIAWDSDKNRIFVTGKLWPKLYEIKLQPIKKLFNMDIERTCMPMPAHF